MYDDQATRPSWDPPPLGTASDVNRLTGPRDRSLAYHKRPAHSQLEQAGVVYRPKLAPTPFRGVLPPERQTTSHTLLHRPSLSMPHAGQLQRAHAWVSKHSWILAATAMQVVFKRIGASLWYVALTFDDPFAVNIAILAAGEASGPQQAGT